MPFEKQLEELAQRKARVLEMGGVDKIDKQHDRGRLTARERIDRLIDAASFLEVGMFDHSDVPGMEGKTPADSKVAGYAKIDGRRVVVIANDFTVLAATSSRVAGRKEGELKVLAAHRGQCSLRRESVGSRQTVRAMANPDEATGGRCLALRCRGPALHPRCYRSAQNQRLHRQGAENMSHRTQRGESATTGWPTGRQNFDDPSAHRSSS